MEQRRVTFRLLPILAATLAFCLLVACGDGTVSSIKSEQKPVSSSVLEADSILSIPGDADSARLVEDMEAGRIPERCNVLYDTMGARPDVDVTNPERIGELYRALARIRVTKGTAQPVTDSYHHVIFYLQDGSYASYNFEGEGVLTRGGTDYSVSGGGSLWRLVRELQDAESNGGSQIS